MKTITKRNTTENALNFVNMHFEADKFPHLNYVNTSIINNEKYIALLNEKKILLSENKVEKTKLEIVNDEISLIEIDDKLSKLHKNLAEKVKYQKEFSEKLLENIDECNKGLPMLISMSIEYINLNVNNKKNEKVADLLNAFNEAENKDLNVDWESRIVFYLSLKRINKTIKKKSKNAE